VARPCAAGFDPVLALARFDAYPLLPAGAAITTGPTSNNFRDLRLPA
jgi:glycerate-2-kinase